MNYDQGIRSLLPSVKLEDELKAEAAAKKFVLDRLGVSTTAKPSVQPPLIMDPLVSSIDIDKILRPKEDEAPDAIEMDKGLDKYRAEPRYKPKKVSERVKYREMMKHLPREARNPTPRVDFKLAESGREAALDLDGRLVRKRKTLSKYLPDEDVEAAMKAGNKIMVDRSSASGFTTMDPIKYDKDKGSFTDGKKHAALSDFKTPEIRGIAKRVLKLT